jgi:hypothetical protein
VAGAILVVLVVALLPGQLPPVRFVSPPPESELPLPAEVVLTGARPGAEFGVRLVDDYGLILAEDAARADATGKIVLELYWGVPASDTGRLEVFAPLPGEEHKVITCRKVRLPELPCSWIAVYFLDQEGKPFPAVRRVPRTAAPASLALRILLAGPTWREGRYGYWSALPPGTELLGISIADGVATVRLDRRPAALAPELRALAKKQLELTLLRFPSVSQVAIYSGDAPL